MKSGSSVLGRSAAATALLLALLLPPAAHAEFPEVSAPTAPAADPLPRTWYGWQIMITDVGAIGLLAGGAALTSMSSSFAFVPIIGGVVYFGDGPLIHGLHHDGDGVARSLILRTSVPLAGAAVGAGLAMLFTVGQQYYTTSDGQVSICV